MDRKVLRSYHKPYANHWHFSPNQLKKDPQQHLSLPATAFAKNDKEWVVLKLQTQTDSTYVFDKVEVEDTMAQNGLRDLKSSVPLSAKEQFLTLGVFDLVSGEGGGHDH